MPVQPRRAALTDSATDTVRLSGVSFGYADGPDVLRDVNLILTAGSFHFLTGPSGAGKSTLLSLLTLARRPTGGSLELFGEEAGGPSRAALPGFRRRMGVVFQDFRLLDHLSAFDNVALPLRLAGAKREAWAADVEEMLDWVGLGDRMDALPPILSGGEKQRAAIARAVISRPQLLLADEPTGSVDPTLGRRLLRLFIELNKSGTAVIIATHDIDLMDQYEARRLVLHQGRLHVYE